MYQCAFANYPDDSLSQQLDPQGVHSIARAMSHLMTSDAGLFVHHALDYKWVVEDRRCEELCTRVVFVRLICEGHHGGRHVCGDRVFALVELSLQRAPDQGTTTTVPAKPPVGIFAPACQETTCNTPVLLARLR